ncbi:regulator of replication initiation timing [Mesoflavibacter sabulilitoris]|uniref:Uncharacterized protein n=1 Tax=Mesoflavibacter zeaxanthinifaciens subsp. sabulilitoris TaxID=1520893 RepID=A0A2T1NAJ3_9FLAO|nr:hypothetical protein [Mesoflavibacter zeaxanthinifaciens]MBB3123719.1 regulator of replication initiation timing [Mesoflavibacter zeaxanthinifaciens subsp. sabulilitoris]PSG89159.1 hypothetical protein C7H61_09385 [Mesoflavibacter zeaxanthinifaciens subsp. sabulilitoris]
MRQITIIAENIELQYVPETLTLKRDNNSFQTDFKVTHTSNPFLIVENQQTKEALGPRDITSVGKKKIVEVDVIELGEKYKGELQILDYINGFRKCNLKYASELYPLLKSKIRDFMPVVSVIPNETDPVPYSETSEEELTGSDNWPAYVLDHLDNVFPQAKWQFPKMKYAELHNDTDPDDDWYTYENYINNQDFNTTTLNFDLVENYYTLNEGSISVFNKNVISPQVFLLTPLFYALQNIGFKLKGEFVQNTFIRKLLLFSKENNLCDIFSVSGVENVIFDNENWQYGYNQTFVTDTITLASAGLYKVKFQLEMNTTDFQWSQVLNNHITNGGLMINYNNTYPTVISMTSLYFLLFDYNDTGILEGEFEFYLDPAHVNQPITFYYVHSEQQMPISQSVKVYRADQEKKYFQMHPTIDSGRYIPDWTVAKYINELKKTFNLKVTPNDFKKELVLDFNENINVNVAPTILNKSFKVSSFNSVANTSFTLSFANNIDNALFITKSTEEIFSTQQDAFNKTIKNEFKLIDHNGVTAELNEAVIDKDGVGLMIYDPANKPNISENYLNQTLQFDGPTGLYAKFWKKWLRFRLSASSLEIEGPLTEIEISKFSKTEEIYIDNQHYRIVSYQFTEVAPGKNKVKFQLESVTL